MTLPLMNTLNRNIRSKAFAFILFFFLCSLVVILYLLIENREAKAIQKHLDEKAINAISLLEADLNKRVKSLERIVSRWQARGGTPKAEFEQDAYHYVIDNPGYQAIEWVDKSFYVRWIVPLSGNEQALDLNLGFEQKRRLAIEKARDEKKPSLSAPITLVQGGQGFLAYNPIFIHDDFSGFILAVFRTHEWLERVIKVSDSSKVDNKLFYKVNMAEQEIYNSQQQINSYNSPFIATASIRFLEQDFYIQVEASSQFVEENQSLFAEIVLIVGFVMSLLIAMTLYLHHKARAAISKSLASFETLESEIIEHKKTESLLAKERKRLNNILEGTNAGTWEWNIQTGETIFNERWAEIVGYTLAELAPISIETWSSLVHPEDGKESGDLLTKHFNKALDYYEFEARMRHKSGEWIWVLDRGRVVKWDSEGKPLYMSGTHQEITERKQIEQATQEAKQAAEKLAESKSFFLASMSHEIRTPMNGIIGLSELALNNDMPEEVRDFLMKIHASSHSLLGILNDVLDFSKLDAGQMEIDKEPLALDQIINNLRHLYQPQASAKAIGFEIHIDQKTPKNLIGDELRIQQILANLISNAIKFTEKGLVSLTISPQEVNESNALIKFVVTDTGIGMNKQGLDVLFEPFCQLDKSITRRFGGTGLGLVICRDLLRLMGSEFIVQSEEEQGSHFEFTLNLELSEQQGLSRELKRQTTQVAGALEAQLASQASDLIGTKVLVVEDNRINQLVVTKVLKLAGIEFCIANHGQEALDILAEQGFDAILMDMNMPVMGGIEATKHIRTTPSLHKIPIIALTAGATKEERIKCMQSGVTDFLAKPIDAQLLISTLLSCMKNSRHNASLNVD